MASSDITSHSKTHIYKFKSANRHKHKLVDGHAHWKTQVNDSLQGNAFTGIHKYVHRVMKHRFQSHPKVNVFLRRTESSSLHA